MDVLTNVVHVPIQCVSAEEKFQVCYVVEGGRTEKRVVETGEFNDEFIEIKSGLKAGEKVLLRSPRTAAPAGEMEEVREAEPAAAEQV